jgi:hydrogenase assembly chaperone HypC/HupF
MCQILPCRVVGVIDSRAELELFDGQRATAGTFLQPDVSVGDYVLVDRGLVVERIDADEAQAILAMYREMDELLQADDAPA